MGTELFHWLPGLVVVLLVVIAAVMYFMRRTSLREENRRALLKPARADAPDRGFPRPWVIYNPSKLDDEQAFRAQIDEVALEFDITHVHWRTTTVEDPGTGQAVAAVADGASIVIAAGGDGTVRAVAAGLAGTAVRMGIIPIGTGNLLARNLALPLDDAAQALRVALGEGHRAVDLGWLRVEDADEPSPCKPEGLLLERARTDVPSLAPDTCGTRPGVDEYSFLVLAGIGFDGQTMADTDPGLKKAIGWPAYVVAALGAISARRMEVELTLVNPRPIEDERPLDWETSDPLQVGVIANAPASPLNAGLEATTSPSGEAPPTEGTENAQLTARSILFANCGELPVVTLAPDARVGDGMIDVVAVDTQIGVVGWLNLATKIFGHGLGIRPVNLPASTGQIAFRQARAATVTVDRPQVVQVDGDAIGSARIVHVRLHEHALDVSVPMT